MKRNYMFYIFGSLIISGFITFLIWLQTTSDEKSILNNSYEINLYKDSGFIFSEINNELLSITTSTLIDKSVKTEFLIPVINFQNNSFRIPIYGVNNMRIYFDEKMYNYQDRITDEEKFSKSPTKTFVNLVKDISKSSNFDCSNLDRSNLTPNRQFIIDNSITKTNIDALSWKSLSDLKIHIDSMVRQKKIGKGEIIDIFFCSRYPNQKVKEELSVQDTDTLTIEGEVTDVKQVKKEEKITFPSSKKEKIGTVNLERIEGTNSFKIITSRRKLNSNDDIKIVITHKGKVIDTKQLSSNELNSSKFSISGDKMKNLLGTTYIKVKFQVKFNGETTTVTPEQRIFCDI